MHASLVLCVFALGSLKGIRAQTNATIALPGFDDQPLTGEIVGTGADGTTYVISASGTDAGDIPFTMTVVQDATHVSEILSIATGIGANAECAYDTQGVGTCTLVVEGAGTGTETDAAPQTLVTTGTIPMLAVPVTTASTSTTTSGSSQTDASSGSSPSSSSAASRSVISIGLAGIFSSIFATLINV